jgi:capsule polysaccharide export protein KpsC/LpsZ
MVPASKTGMVRIVGINFFSFWNISVIRVNSIKRYQDRSRLSILYAAVGGVRTAGVKGLL